MSSTNSKAQTDRKSQQNLLPIDPNKLNWLKSKIRDVTDFPKPGIIFKDLTTLFNDSEAFEYVIDVLAAKYEPLAPTYVAAIEARGFILGAPLAYKLGVGFIPIRKPGKLPAAVHRFSYDLEYGSDAVEIHQDAAKNGERVVLVDDLLATGGTANAAYQLLKGIGSEVVGIGFVTELGFLPGRARLPADIDIFSLITY